MAAEPGGGTDLHDPFTVPEGAWSRRVELRDGTPVLLRQIRAEDRDRLAEGLRRLSAPSRYLRFHADLEELTDRQLEYLTEVDHVDHEAIVALDLDAPEVPGVGVARYIRDPHQRHIAEAAITVADEYQGKGAGTLLLGVLSTHARRHGIEVFRNYVLASNSAMLEVFDHLGAHRELETTGLWRVDLPLPEHESDLPDSPAGKAFLQAAKEGFRFSSLFPPVLCHLPWRARGGDAGAIEEELTGLRDELSRWLADRDSRDPAWPSDDED